MGGNRFSEKDMRQQRDLERFPIPFNREVVQSMIRKSMPSGLTRSVDTVFRKDHAPLKI
jgi:hypothetical protein